MKGVLALTPLSGNGFTDGNGSFVLGFVTNGEDSCANAVEFILNQKIEVANLSIPTPFRNAQN